MVTSVYSFCNLIKLFVAFSVYRTEWLILLSWICRIRKVRIFLNEIWFRVNLTLGLCTMSRISCTYRGVWKFLACAPRAVVCVIVLRAAPTTPALLTHTASYSRPLPLPPPPLSASRMRLTWNLHGSANHVVRNVEDDENYCMVAGDHEYYCVRF